MLDCCFAVFWKRSLRNWCACEHSDVPLCVSQTLTFETLILLLVISWDRIPQVKATVPCITWSVTCVRFTSLISQGGGWEIQMYKTTHVQVRKFVRTVFVNTVLVCVHCVRARVPYLRVCVGGSAVHASKMTVDTERHWYWPRQTYRHTHTHTHTHVRTYVHTYVRTHVRTYTHIRTYTHTHTYTERERER
jgi:hypothetical protein